MLNARVWVAGIEVPPQGVPSKTLAFEELEANMDEPRSGKADIEAIRAKLRKWQGDSGSAK